jgi:hypothetical protein
MKQLAARARRWTKIVRAGHSRFLFDRLRRAVWSQERFLILRKDLTEVQHPRPSAVLFSIRPFEASDLSILEGEPFSAEDADAREQRRHWVEGGLPGCYVAVLKSGEPCYMQWLLRHSDRQTILDFFGDTLPTLDPATVLLEGAYTSPRYRRLPIMPAAMARIASLGREFGARQAIVSIAEGNTTMIKSAQWAGFKTASVTVEQRRLFRRLQTDSPLPA